jgi:predicted RNase H-like nuclease (RuvC/YqgF family)
MSEVCAHGNLERQCETCAAWESAVYNQRRAEKAEARVKELERERDALSNGQETLRFQTARIRRELTNVVEIARRVRCERDEVRRKLADKQWVIATMTADIERAGGVVTFHDGGMGQSPSGYHRKPYVQMKGRCVDADEDANH